MVTVLDTRKVSSGTTRVLSTPRNPYAKLFASGEVLAPRILMPEGRFYPMEMRKPNTEPRSFTNEEYLGRLSKPRAEISRERIWNPEVRVHGLIATVWAPYDFWIDGKFSHCSVDAFDLIKTAEGWKISGGAFTMESKCEPSPLGPPKQ